MPLAPGPSSGPRPEYSSARDVRHQSSLITGQKLTCHSRFCHLWLVVLMMSTLTLPELRPGQHDFDCQK